MTIDKVKKSRFNVGDRVWINPQEAEYGPFKAIITKVECSYFNGYFGPIEYGILEVIQGAYEANELAHPSDGWTEEMLSISYPR